MKRGSPNPTKGCRPAAAGRVERSETKAAADGDCAIAVSRISHGRSR
jgi:hypothetical protein